MSSKNNKINKTRTITINPYYIDLLESKGLNAADLVGKFMMSFINDLRRYEFEEYQRDVFAKRLHTEFNLTEFEIDALIKLFERISFERFLDAWDEERSKFCSIRRKDEYLKKIDRLSRLKDYDINQIEHLPPVREMEAMDPNFDIHRYVHLLKRYEYLSKEDETAIRIADKIERL